MDDRELILGLRAIGAERTSYPDAADVRRHLLAIPIDRITRRRTWLPLPQRVVRPLAGAVGFAAAAAVVALAGGILISGLVAAPEQEELPAVGASASASTMSIPSVEPTRVAGPLVRADILPGAQLEVSEVEPGVLRVINDGLRDLSWSFPFDESGQFPLPGLSITAGPDESVWVSTSDGYYRLGTDGTGGWEATGSGQLYVGTTGDVYVRNATVHRVADAAGIGAPSTAVGARVDAVTLGPDGRLWFADRREDAACGGRRCPIVVSLAGAGERRSRHTVPDALGQVRLPGVEGLWVTSDGEAWLWHRWRLSNDPTDPTVDWLSRVSGGSPASAESPAGELFQADMSPSGIFWALILPDPRSAFASELVRWDGREWTIFDESDGVPPVPGPSAPSLRREGHIAAAIDGGVWLNPVIPGILECRGVAHFSGESVQAFLEDHCVAAMDVAPDGSLWVQAWAQTSSDDGSVSVETYVIRPEATEEEG